jgi:hypothetical protein
MPHMARKRRIFGPHPRGLALLLPLLAALPLASAARSQADGRPQGPCFGLTPPLASPAVFAPGFISTERNELNAAFAPDGSEFFFSVGIPGAGYRIWRTRQVAGSWTTPEPAPFCRDDSAVDMAFSADGSRLYYCSTRPMADGGPRSEGFRIWYVEREGGDWGAPRLLPGPVNEGRQQVHPAFARDGTLYFQAVRDDSRGEADVYRARLVDGQYREPENLGPAINSERHEGDVAVDAEQTVLVVSVTGRDDGCGRGDLYVSFRGDDGAWGPLANMGPAFNTPHHEYCPVLTPDGRAFFFTRRVEGAGDIFWVDSGAVLALAPGLPGRAAAAGDQEAAWMGPYLGQPPPSDEPRLFAPGLATTGRGDGCVAFGAGQRLFLHQWFAGGRAHTVCLEQRDGRWTAPAPLPFLATHPPGDFTLGPDGLTLWFETRMAADGSPLAAERSDIWKAVWSPEGWSRPQPVGPGVNTKHHESYPSAASDGTLWFFSRRPGGRGRADLYFAPAWRDGRLDAPRNAGPRFNTEHDEWDPWIAPDGSLLLFCSTKPGSYGEDDLYVSFRDGDGEWTEPANLGLRVNSSYSENRPSLSPDGRYLFFTSTRRGNRDVYWVSAKVLEGLRP